MARLAHVLTRLITTGLLLVELVIRNVSLRIAVPDSRSWTFDRLNTLTCGFTSQVDEICALTRLNS